MKLLALCATLFVCIQAANIPSYISKCCMSTSNLTECLLKEAKRVIPILLYGDKQFNIVRLLPYMEVQRYLLKNHDGTFVLNVLRLWGLDSVTVLSFKPEFEKRSGISKYHFRSLRFQFTYKIDIFHTPLNGFGRGEIILEDVTIIQTLNFAADSDNYSYLKDSNIKLSAANIAYNLENLPSEAEDYLEENYDQLNEMFLPNIRRLLNAVLVAPLSALGELIKFQDELLFGKDCNKRGKNKK